MSFFPSCSPFRDFTSVPVPLEEWFDDYDANGYGVFANGLLSKCLGEMDHLQNNDILEMKLDCNQWTLKVYKNNVKCTDLEIEKDKTYHPAFTIWCDRVADFQLIEPPLELE